MGDSDGSEPRRPNNHLAEFYAAQARLDNISYQLPRVSVQQALEKWLATLSPATAKSYGEAFKRLKKLELAIIDCNLFEFSMFNHEAVIDNIKSYKPWSEGTRQARAAAYISFTGFLERHTEGIIKKAKIISKGVNKTFPRIREKVKTRPLSKRQTRIFLAELDKKKNPRYALIARVMLQGGKRSNEVLSLQIKNVNFEKSQITFKQSKTRGTDKVTIINYPKHVMKALKKYIGSRKTGLVFINRTGKKIWSGDLRNSFILIGKRAKIPFSMTPHVLRVTLVTRLKELRIQDSDIIKVTGHSNVKEMAKYDKSDMGYNATLHHNFV